MADIRFPDLGIIASNGRFVQFSRQTALDHMRRLSCGAAADTVLR
ncbi:hypothetical protein [Bradyrhizobium jicamae]|nr:hypothetical protein [Bradyrhizobium jicamae]